MQLIKEADAREGAIFGAAEGEATDQQLRLGFSAAGPSGVSDRSSLWELASLPAWDFNADSGSAPPPRLESTKAWPWRWRRTKVLSNTVHHLMTNVLPAARDYEQAEDELSHAFARDADPKTWQQEGQQAKRRAAEVAIAIDGLADRAAAALGLTPEDVRKQVARRCVIGGATRPGSIERVCAVANAYKHSGPLHTRHPITSESDVLATGAGYGIDAFGVGKFSGVEVLVNQKDGCAKIPCRRSFGNGGLVSVPY